MAAALSGKVQTVLGCIDPSQVGITHCHEHLSMTFNCSYHPAPKGKESMEEAPIDMGNIRWIQQYPYSHKSNLLFNDPETESGVFNDVKRFKELGGSTLVDNTTIGIDRNMQFQKKVAQETGVNIVAGAGYYVGAAQPSSVNQMTIEDLEKQITDEILVGADGTDIKCGVIGEIGCSYPLQANEKKVLQAAARVQAKLGCPLIIHPGRDKRAPMEIVSIIQGEGGDVKKTVMSHLDRTIHDHEELVQLAKTGVLLEWDLFGVEMLVYQYKHEMDMPSDNQRIDTIKRILDAGYEDQVVIAHDVHTKHRLTKFGGHGYQHILENIVPRMLSKGITQSQVDKMLIENPKKWLTFK